MSVFELINLALKRYSGGINRRTAFVSCEEPVEPVEFLLTEKEHVARESQLFENPDRLTDIPYRETFRVGRKESLFSKLAPTPKILPPNEDTPLAYLENKRVTLEKEIGSNIAKHREAIMCGDPSVSRLRLMIRSNYHQLSETFMSLEELYQREAGVVNDLLNDLRLWDAERSEILSAISHEKSPSSRDGAKLASLLDSTHEVDNEIEKLQNQLANMMTKKRVLSNEIQNTSSVLESRTLKKVELFRQLERIGRKRFALYLLRLNVPKEEVQTLMPAIPVDITFKLAYKRGFGVAWANASKELSSENDERCKPVVELSHKTSTKPLMLASDHDSDVSRRNVKDFSLVTGGRIEGESVDTSSRTTSKLLGSEERPPKSDLLPFQSDNDDDDDDDDEGMISDDSNLLIPNVQRSPSSPVSPCDFTVYDLKIDSGTVNGEKQVFQSPQDSIGMKPYLPQETMRLETGFSPSPVIVSTSGGIPEFEEIANDSLDSQNNPPEILMAEMNHGHGATPFERGYALGARKGVSLRQRLADLVQPLLQVVPDSRDLFTSSLDAGPSVILGKELCFEDPTNTISEKLDFNAVEPFLVVKYEGLLSLAKENGDKSAIFHKYMVYWEAIVKIMATQELKLSNCITKSSLLDEEETRGQFSDTLRAALTQIKLRLDAADDGSEVITSPINSEVQGICRALAVVEDKQFEEIYRDEFGF